MHFTFPYIRKKKLFCEWNNFFNYSEFENPVDCSHAQLLQNNHSVSSGEIQAISYFSPGNNQNSRTWDKSKKTDICISHPKGENFEKCYPFCSESSGKKD